MKMTKNQIIYYVSLLTLLILFFLIAFKFNFVPYKGSGLTANQLAENNKIIPNMIAYIVAFWSVIWTIQGFMLWKTNFFKPPQFRGMELYLNHGKLACAGGLIGTILSAIYFLFFMR